MKHFFVTASTLALALAGTHASAQTISSTGFTPYGYVALSTFGVTNGSSDSFFSADAGFHWNFADNFGLDGSIYGIATESGHSEAIYLALTYDFDAVRLSFGAPRAAFDQYGRMRVEDTLSFIGFSAAPLTKSLVTYLDLYGSASGEHSFGARIDGTTSGGLEYAVSVHGFSEYPDSASINGSLRYRFGEGVILTGGLEYDFSPSGDDITKAKIGVSKDFGRYELGIMSTATTGFAPSTLSMTELWGAYDVNDRFEVGASFLMLSSGADLVTLDASYEIFPSGTLKAALSRPTSGSSETLYSVGLRYDF